MSEETPGDLRRKLEIEARQARRAEQELAEVRAQAHAAGRELEMRRAGVDVDSPVGAMFAKAYDGALDPEAIREHAAQVGALGNTYPPAQRAAMERISAAASGGHPGGGYSQNFEDELDAIPMVIGGEYNQNYVNEVLSKTAQQAAKEGRTMAVNGGTKNGGHVRVWSNSAGANAPATTPLKG